MNRQFAILHLHQEKDGALALFVSFEPPLEDPWCIGAPDGVPQDDVVALAQKLVELAVERGVRVSR
jgi:hypothetical protein